MIYNFDTPAEYIDFVKSNKTEVVTSIVQGINIALELGLDNAVLMELNFDRHKQAFEISLDKSQWEASLDACIEIFMENNESDNAIDTYLVKKKLIEQYTN